MGIRVGEHGSGKPSKNRNNIGLVKDEVPSAMDASAIIIGSGYSAAAALVHLTHAGLPLRQILVIGPGELGTGQAYGCTAKSYRLNIRVTGQRLWPDQPEHFADWATEHIQDPDAHTPAGSFYRRSDFAQYITAQLALIPDAKAFRQINAWATNITGEDNDWLVACDDGAQYRAERLVLATGNPDPEWPTGIKPGRAPSLVRAPWRGDWVTQVKSKMHVCVVGAGLTAMDALHALGMQQHQGPISLLAPHGMLPPSQVDWGVPEPAHDWPTGLRGSDFSREIRQYLGTRSWHHRDCQQRFEALRVNVNPPWQMLPPKDRVRLQRRLGWLWSLIRFRANPQTVASVKAMKASGQLKIIKTHLHGLTKADSGRWLVKLSNGEELTTHVVVNCTGMGRDKLIDTMIAAGQIAPIETTRQPWINSELRVVASDGRPYDTLFCIGPATGLALGDVLGATSIAHQAVQLAKTLVTNTSFKRVR